MEQARTDYEDGPAEMIFPHEYHTSSIEDMQWNPNPSSHFKMSLASIETNMTMAIWQPKKSEILDDPIDNYRLVDKIDPTLLE